jgi:hypothetical protein
MILVLDPSVAIAHRLIAIAGLSRNARFDDTVRVVVRGKDVTFIGNWLILLSHMCVQRQELIFPTLNW